VWKKFHTTLLSLLRIFSHINFVFIIYNFLVSLVGYSYQRHRCGFFIMVGTDTNIFCVLIRINMISSKPCYQWYNFPLRKTWQGEDCVIFFFTNLTTFSTANLYRSRKFSNFASCRSLNRWERVQAGEGTKNGKRFYTSFIAYSVLPIWFRLVF
jgi:hypothetical protein